MDIVTEDLALTELRGRSIFELSGGEKQRIACGSVAVMFPKVIVLDEPSSNLDSESIEKLKCVLAKWKQQGKTVIILERFGIKNLAENHPMAFSGGQKQRVAIASSVAAGRDIILMDEPTSGMDELNMTRLSQELKSLKKAGKTVYVVTHDYEFINDCCDSVIKLD